MIARTLLGRNMAVRPWARRAARRVRALVFAAFGPRGADAIRDFSGGVATTTRSRFDRQLDAAWLDVARRERDLEAVADRVAVMQVALESVCRVRRICQEYSVGGDATLELLERWRREALDLAEAVVRQTLPELSDDAVARLADELAAATQETPAAIYHVGLELIRTASEGGGGDVGG